MTYTFTFILLVFYSILDLRHKEISAWLLYAGTAVIFIIGIISRVLLKTDIICYIIISLAIYGVICLMAKTLQQWIGEADFDVIFMICLTIGTRNFIIFSFSIFAVSGLVYVWLAMRKADRNRRLPLIPILTIAYAITIISGGGVY